jgi:hypothetical protein
MPWMETISLLVLLALAWFWFDSFQARAAGMAAARAACAAENLLLLDDTVALGGCARRAMTMAACACGVSITSSTAIPATIAGRATSPCSAAICCCCTCRMRQPPGYGWWPAAASEVH